MGDTQHDGSDSDWDSTLDFTSPRHTGIKFPPHMNVEEVSDSDLSDGGGTLQSEQRNISRNASATDLKLVEDRSRPVTPQQSTTILTPQAGPPKTPRQREILREAAESPAPPDDPSPPYNFRGQTETAPVLAAQRPGKDRKGNTYDPAPSPSPRGINKFQDSIKSVGSWDESDQDERTLRELRVNYSKQKQKEDEHKQRIKEQQSQKSEMEDLQSQRSEKTWKSVTSNKFGKRSRSGQQSSPQPQLSRSTTPIPQIKSATHQDMVTLTVPSHRQQKLDNSTPQQFFGPAFTPSYALPPPEVVDPAEEVEEPKTLIFHDEDRGRYVYFFGHGNLRYYEVNEEFEEAVIPGVADKIDRVIRRVWQEFFAVLRIVSSLLIWFIVELFRFVTQHLLLPIVLGVFVSIGDFFVKPLLSALFNGFVQPFNIFLWNVFTGMKHVFRPIGVIFLRILEQFAMCCRSVRLVEINWKTNQQLPAGYNIQTV